MIPQLLLVGLLTGAGGTPAAATVAAPAWSAPTLAAPAWTAPTWMTRP